MARKIYTSKADSFSGLRIFAHLNFVFRSLLGDCDLGAVRSEGGDPAQASHNGTCCICRHVAACCRENQIFVVKANYCIAECIGSGGMFVGLVD